MGGSSRRTRQGEPVPGVARPDVGVAGRRRNTPCPAPASSTWKGCRRPNCGVGSRRRCCRSRRSFPPTFRRWRRRRPGRRPARDAPPMPVRRVDAARAELAAVLRSLQDGHHRRHPREDAADTQVLLEEAADALGAEPPPRALSPIVYEPKAKVFVLFGGDHCDYLTNDTWVFDPAVAPMVAAAPGVGPAAARQPHAGRPTATASSSSPAATPTSPTPTTWAASTSIWTTASGPTTSPPTPGRAAAASRRAGRQPDVPHRAVPARSSSSTGPQPDAAAFQAKLKALPANVWTKTNPPASAAGQPRLGHGGHRPRPRPDPPLVRRPLRPRRHRRARNTTSPPTAGNCATPSSSRSASSTPTPNTPTASTSTTAPGSAATPTRTTASTRC